jgi:putative endonuclease
METSDVSSSLKSSRYYVYVLLCHGNRSIYIGYTTNLKNRLLLHSHGKVISTKRRIPVTLIHYEYFIHRTDAKAREEYLKSGYGKRQLVDIIKRTLAMYDSD